MFKALRNAVIIFFMASPFATADLLPTPESLTIEGDTLIWDSVESATGYNIYLNYNYFDTVKGDTSYNLTQSGIYWVVAFDNAGNFGSQYGNDDVVEFTGSDNSDKTSVTYNWGTSVVQTTCTNVGPGESCIATCEMTKTELSEYPTRSKYMSGGACSTSDIVEADAFVGHKTYKCTVPTFSGEVVAQAICVH